MHVRNDGRSAIDCSQACAIMTSSWMGVQSLFCKQVLQFHVVIQVSGVHVILSPTHDDPLSHKCYSTKKVALNITNQCTRLLPGG